MPALASVGLTEQATHAAGHEVEVKLNDMTGWRSAKTHAETAAFAKVPVDKQSSHILGAHLLGHGAGEIVHLIAFAIKYGIMAEVLKDEVYAYPTFSSDIKFLV